MPKRRRMCWTSEHQVILQCNTQKETQLRFKLLAQWRKFCLLNWFFFFGFRTFDFLIISSEFFFCFFFHQSCSWKDLPKKCWAHKVKKTKFDWSYRANVWKLRIFVARYCRISLMKSILHTLVFTLYYWRLLKQIFSVEF